MSRLGEHWRIDGVTAAYITRGSANGRYNVVFERPGAELPQIEAINWAQPTVEHLVDRDEQGLPEGYGFEVVRITYASGNLTYTVELQVASQYLGDVTGYQAQIAELNETVASQAATIQTQAETAAALTADMESAYQEGVESNG